MALQLLRNTRLFVSTVTTGFTKANTQEILVQDDVSWGQDSNSTDITANEAGPVPTRGSKRFIDSLNPADWNFSTYILPYLDATSKKQLLPDYILWHALASGKPVDLVAGNGGKSTATNYLVNFKDNSVHELLPINIYILTEGTWTQITECQVGQAEIAVDIEDLGRVTWTGNGRQIKALGTQPFDPNALGIDDATYALIQSSFIKNKLTVLKLKNNVGNIVYDIPITGGTITINNNVTYVTPNIMSKVNIAVGSFTGAFDVSGSVTAYLNNKTLGAAKLYQDLLASMKTTNSFEMALILGGEYDTARTAAVFVAKTAQLSIPTVETEDIISTTIEFKGIPTDMGAGDEGYLGFSSGYTKTSIAKLISTGDGTPAP